MEQYTLNKLKWGKVKAKDYKTTAYSHLIFHSDLDNYLTFCFSQSKSQSLKYLGRYVKVIEMFKNRNHWKTGYTLPVVFVVFSFFCSEFFMNCTKNSILGVKLKRFDKILSSSIHLNVDMTFSCQKLVLLKIHNQFLCD